MKVEVRAARLKAMREKRGLTQRQLAQDLGISQNFSCRFEDLFDVVLVDPETGREQVFAVKDGS